MRWRQGGGLLGGAPGGGEVLGRAPRQRRQPWCEAVGRLYGPGTGGDWRRMRSLRGVSTTAAPARLPAAAGLLESKLRLSGGSAGCPPRPPPPRGSPNPASPRCCARSADGKTVRHDAARLHQVIGPARQEAACAGLGLHLAVAHHHLAAADRRHGPASDPQPLLGRVLDGVLHQPLGSRYLFCRIPPHHHRCPSLLDPPLPPAHAPSPPPFLPAALPPPIHTLAPPLTPSPLSPP